MITVYNVMLVTLGALLAALALLFLMPAYRRRIERFTLEQIKRSLPITENEIRADKDRLRLEDRIYIEFIDDPQAGLERPKTKINTAAGAVFGLLLGVTLIFLLEWLASGVIRRSEDVERYLDIPVIGRIPQQ